MTRIIDANMLAELLVATNEAADPCDPRAAAGGVVNRFTYGLTDYEREEVARIARFLSEYRATSPRRVRERTLALGCRS